MSTNEKKTVGGIKGIDWKRYAMDCYGYEIITTFGSDFDIAEAFGADAIRDTFDRAFNEWKSNYKYLTELVLILNWKIAQHYGKNDTYARLYDGIMENCGRLRLRQPGRRRSAILLQDNGLKGGNYGSGYRK